MKIDLKTATLSILRAMALSVAREIDAGKREPEQFELLEHIMSFIPTAKRGHWQ